ncbi:MAG: hypothetical protein N2Z21_00940, partial [Candidatus Sumerlaeaceae bacterium]|nr:hypothetical protein [Candidatus Sumerlaeaceae bacterium]
MASSPSASDIILVVRLGRVKGFGLLELRHNATSPKARIIPFLGQESFSLLALVFVNVPDARPIPVSYTHLTLPT